MILSQFANNRAFVLSHSVKNKFDKDLVKNLLATLNVAADSKKIVQ